jgi:hypothetical protein
MFQEIKFISIRLEVCMNLLSFRVNRICCPQLAKFMPRYEQTEDAHSGIGKSVIAPYMLLACLLIDWSPSQPAYSEFRRVRNGSR